MTKKLLVSTLLAAVLSPVAIHGATYCNSTVVPKPTDIVFLLDGSGSMCPYIKNITAGFGSFADSLVHGGIDARFAIVGFGGQPRLFLPFTSNITQVQAAFAPLNDCNLGGQEAGLEALRYVLPPKSGADLLKKCVDPSYNGTACNLTYRANASVTVIMATDEDSDIPTTKSYLVSGQVPGNTTGCADQSYKPFNNGSEKDCSSSFEPLMVSDKVFWGTNTSAIDPKTNLSVVTTHYQWWRSSNKPLLLHPSYYTEINATADVVTGNGVTVMLLMRPDQNANGNGPISIFNSYSTYWSKNTPKNVTDGNHSAIVQYGNPGLASQNTDFSNFSASTTLASLNKGGLASSFQAQVLARGGLAKLYTITSFINNPNVVKNFYTQVQYVSTNCWTVADPSPVQPSPVASTIPSAAPSIAVASRVPSPVVASTTVAPSPVASAAAASPVASPAAHDGGSQPAVAASAAPSAAASAAAASPVIASAAASAAPTSAAPVPSPTLDDGSGAAIPSQTQATVSPTTTPTETPSNQDGPGAPIPSETPVISPAPSASPSSTPSASSGPSTTVIAGAAGATVAAGAAAAFFVSRRKSSLAAADAMADSTDELGATNAFSNPLYGQQHGFSTNPLYENAAQSDFESLGSSQMLV
ncbi:hypothetical protein SmJEL517_g04093 [Synchytrium microbalum]|uniref:VWFA domain-containing protein n=1 Tax=Synchytrium microbalum TaxID=1806994 RepID=A0A507BVH5_9FUNG|nr:uncharacterized protein SmJEL517_g04093 [Synchytrium microbalum]TPX32887.1 hypothetical protein SmJEL517_g04093 [Synchytrium microbalum]